MSHANALLTPKGRLRLARCVVEDGWSLRRAAERFQVSVTTAARWAARYRAHGEARDAGPFQPACQLPAADACAAGAADHRDQGQPPLGACQDRLSAGHPSVHGAPGPVQVRAGTVVLAGPCHRQSDPPLRAPPAPGTWSTSTSRNSDASLTAAATEASAGPPETGTRPAPRRTGDRATLSSTTPSMTIPGSLIPRSWPMRRRTPRPASGNVPTPTSNPAESPSNGS